jgi:hypothetical protein
VREPEAGAEDAPKPKEPTKKELRKMERERKAREQLAAKAAEDAANFKFFGDLPLNQSTETTSRTWNR